MPRVWQLTNGYSRQHQFPSTKTICMPRSGLDQIACCVVQLMGGRQRPGGGPIIQGEELRDGIPGAAMVVVENCGHMAPLEQPAALARLVVDWMRTG